MYDFFSDTKTIPTRGMREAILDAVVGDEQKDEDPTTRALCDRVANLLGKEAAILLPTGTMCNEIAVKLHTQPGDEVICEETCHLINFETGGPAALSGVMIRTIAGTNGFYEPTQLKAAIRPSSSRYAPRSRLICVEQTANMAGGTVWPLDTLGKVAEVARRAGLATHMDGARLLNASAATGIAPADYAAGFDTVWIDFSKGLGTPMGAVLAGSADMMQQAWRIKQMMGGAMRQSGILAAMCLYGLDHHVDRLSEDHRLARHLADSISELPQVKNMLPVETNIVIFDLDESAPLAADLVAAMKTDGVLVGAFGPRRIRIVTHLGVDMAGTDALLGVLKKHL